MYTKLTNLDIISKRQSICFILPSLSIKMESPIQKGWSALQLETYTGTSWIYSRLCPHTKHFARKSGIHPFKYFFCNDCNLGMHLRCTRWSSEKSITWNVDQTTLTPLIQLSRESEFIVIEIMNFIHVENSRFSRFYTFSVFNLMQFRNFLNNHLGGAQWIEL